jgi:hypothetical protein
MSDQPSASGDSVDLQNLNVPQRAAAAENDNSVQTEVSSEGPQRRTSRTARKKSWFGRDERHSVAFYGDYYR